MDTTPSDAQAFTIPQGTFWASPSEDSKMFYNLSKLKTFYDADFAATLGANLKPDAIVIDVGANIGEFSVAVAPHAKKVYAFEPVARSRALLQKNTASSPTVEIIDCALSNTEGTVTLAPDTKNNSGTYRVTGSGTIPLRTLDSFNLTPDFIKIDVQGLDIRVLQGAARTIAKNKPVLLFEISDLTIKYGGISSLRKILPGYTLRFFPSLKPVSLLSLWGELAARYYLKRPRHYDLLATPPQA